MHVRGWRSILGLVGVAIVVTGSAVYARRQASGSVTPAKFLVLNKTPAESLPVTLTAVDPKFPTLPVVVLAATDTELGERTLLRLTASKRPSWDYQVLSVVDTDMPARLSAEGRDGWELVSVLPTEKGHTLVLKRSR